MSSATGSGTNGVRRWILVSAAIATLGIAVGAILLALNWPFTEAAVTKTLQDRFTRQVTVRKFRSTYWPPGCVAEGVEFLHRKRKDLPPLISVEKLVLRTGYTGLFRITKVIDNVQLVGLHIKVPPKNPNATQQTFPLTHSVSGKTLTIGEITTDNAVVEFLSRQPDEDRFILKIYHLTLDHLP